MVFIFLVISDADYEVELHALSSFTPVYVNATYLELKIHKIQMEKNEKKIIGRYSSCWCVFLVVFFQQQYFQRYNVIHLQYMLKLAYVREIEKGKKRK